MTAESPIVSAGALAEMLGLGSRPVVLDVRWTLAGGSDRDAYRAGHIPGAAFVDLDRELASAPGSRGRHPLPDAGGFARAMRRAGVRSDALVVTYDAAEGLAAARAWWLLRHHGHGQVAVLDGGLRAWRAAGHPLELGEETPVPGDFAGTPGAMPLLDAAGAAEIARRGILLDARAPQRFRGEHEPIDPVAGHIPGAINLPHTTNLDAAQERFRSPSALRETFARLGVRHGAEVGAYCGSGVSAAQTVLALELAGYRGALYAGSWSEWIADPRRPVALGD